MDRRRGGRRVAVHRGYCHGDGWLVVVLWLVFERGVWVWARRDLSAMKGALDFLECISIAVRCFMSERLMLDPRRALTA